MTLLGRFPNRWDKVRGSFLPTSGPAFCNRLKLNDKERCSRLVRDVPFRTLYRV